METTVVDFRSFGLTISGNGSAELKLDIALRNCKQFKEIKRMMKGAIKPSKKKKKKSSKGRKAKQNPRAKKEINKTANAFDLSEFGSFKN